MATKDELQHENERLKDEAAAANVRQDQMLDMLAELENRLKAIEQSGGAVTKAVEQNDEQARFDAELEALKAEFATDPAIQIFERRVLEGKDAGTEIRLTDEPLLADDPQGLSRQWKLRWFNLGKEGRAQQAMQEGYVKVTWSELQDQESVVSDDKSSEFVRKGERGQEVLYKMRLRLFDYKKRRDAAARQGLLTSASRMRDHLANSVASRAGALGDNADRAGSFVHGGIELTVTEGARETVTL